MKEVHPIFKEVNEVLGIKSPPAPPASLEELRKSVEELKSHNEELKAQHSLAAADIINLISRVQILAGELERAKWQRIVASQEYVKCSGCGSNITGQQVGVAENLGNGQVKYTCQKCLLPWKANESQLKRWWERWLNG